MINEFTGFGLSETTLAAVNNLGYLIPTPVQEQSIPLILAGRDVAAAAQTGTGKTAAFLLPIMDRLALTKPNKKRRRRRGFQGKGHGHGHDGQGQGRGQGLAEAPSPLTHTSQMSHGSPASGAAALPGQPLGTRAPHCLIITPTRELAQQIDQVAGVIAQQTNHRVLVAVGGVAYHHQINTLNRGIDILVATPGRLLDLIERRAVDLTSVKVLVLDEADRMLDMGFWPSVRKIVALASNRKQTLLFSATLSSEVVTKAKPLMVEPVFVQVSHQGETAELVEQRIMPVEHLQKPDLLAAVLRAKGSKRVIVFTRTKSRADSCAKRLNMNGICARAIHADRSQVQRERALADFRNGKVDVLVATDVLARGIDVSDVRYVFNYDVPTNAEDYVHRIGRTGRAGETGMAFTFVSPDELEKLRAIEKLIDTVIPTYDLEGFAYREGRIVPSSTRVAKKKPVPAFSGPRRNMRGFRR